MNLDLERTKIANELWEGADLPEPLNNEGVRIDWYKRYQGKPNTWVRAYFNGKDYTKFVIKWVNRTSEVKFAVIK